MAGHPAAVAVYAGTPDLVGVWDSTVTTNSPSTEYCSTTISSVSSTTFSGTGSCTNAGLNTLSGTIAADGMTFAYTSTNSLPSPWTASATGTYDPINHTSSSVWQCTSGLGPMCATFNGTVFSTHLPPLASLVFPGTFSVGSGTTIAWSDAGSFTVSPESLTAGNPPAPGMTWAHIFGYRFEPPQISSPCTAGSPAGPPYNGVGSGGPQLTFHVPVEQVVPSALPISVFVFNSLIGEWENVGAANVSDGSGGYNVSATVCHFSLYAAFGPAPLAPPAPSVGGTAEQPDVAALPSNAPSRGRSNTIYFLGGAVAFSVAVASAAGWRRRRS